jgi:hypothetical protein
MARGPHAAGAALAAALVLTACGGGSSGGGGGAGPKAEPLGEKLGGSVAQLANCSDWRGGARDRKLATVADIRNQINRDDTGIVSPPLSDAEAVQLFDRECGQPYAKGFRLYVLYARAAGFGPLVRE